MKDVFRKLSRTACVRGTRRLSIFIFHPSSFTFHLLYMLQIYEKDFEYTRILPGKIWLLPFFCTFGFAEGTSVRQ